MIPIEFGIIEEIETDKDYGTEYNPKKYGCVAIDDDTYINNWWKKLITMKVYFHKMSRPDFGLARWGVTLIPPESLPILQDIIITDKRIYEDDDLVILAEKVKTAIDENKFMIVYGV